MEGLEEWYLRRRSSFLYNLFFTPPFIASSLLSLPLILRRSSEAWYAFASFMMDQEAASNFDKQTGSVNPHWAVCIGL